MLRMLARAAVLLIAAFIVGAFLCDDPSQYALAGVATMFLWGPAIIILREARRHACRGR